jgi:hypothetical protein
MLSTVCADYITPTAATKKWTPKTRFSNKNAAELLIELLGDKPLDAVTKEDMRRAYLDLTRVPSNASKRYTGLSVTDAIAAADTAAVLENR